MEALGHVPSVPSPKSGTGRRPRYMIFINFQYIVSKMLRLRGSARTPLGGGGGLQLPRTPSGKRWVTPLQRAPQNCGPRAPRPHDPPLRVQVTFQCNWALVGRETRSEYIRSSLPFLHRRAAIPVVLAVPMITGFFVLLRGGFPAAMRPADILGRDLTTVDQVTLSGGKAIVAHDDVVRAVGGRATARGAHDDVWTAGG